MAQARGQSASTAKALIAQWPIMFFGCAGVVDLKALGMALFGAFARAPRKRNPKRR